MIILNVCEYLVFENSSFIEKKQDKKKLTKQETDFSLYIFFLYSTSFSRGASGDL